MQLLTREDFLDMRRAGKVAAYILRKLKKFIQPGITTKDIEIFFDRELEKYPDMSPAFKGFMGYPASVCVSVNEEVIHGIPSIKKVVYDGDVVSVDLGIKYKGLFVDTAYTYLVGKCSPLARKLVQITLRALNVGVRQAKVGAKVGDVGATIQNYIESNKFSVIRKFVGHGIGHSLHLSPEVPNFGMKGKGDAFLEGCAIAIEPMVSAGNFEVDVLDDGWTAKTEDNSIAAHFEHTVAITKHGPWILTN